MSDLIAAIATGSTATAIGIVRVSGDGCFAACDRIFRPRNGKPFADQPSHKMVFVIWSLISANFRSRGSFLMAASRRWATERSGASSV